MTRRIASFALERLLRGPLSLVRAPFYRHGIAYKFSQMTPELRASLDAQPMTVRCALEDCSWSFSGRAVEGREAAAAHRAEVHPDWRPPRRKRR